MSIGSYVYAPSADGFSSRLSRSGRPRNSAFENTPCEIHSAPAFISARVARSPAAQSVPSHDGATTPFNPATCSRSKAEPRSKISCSPAPGATREAGSPWPSSQPM